MADLHSKRTSPHLQAKSPSPTGYVPAHKLHAVSRRLSKALQTLDDLRYQAINPEQLVHLTAPLFTPQGDELGMSEQQATEGEFRTYFLSQAALADEKAMLVRQRVEDPEYLLDYAASILASHQGLLNLMDLPENKSEETVTALLETLQPVLEAVQDMRLLWQHMRRVAI